MGAERCDDYLWQNHRPTASLGLGLEYGEPAIDPGERVPDEESTSIQVDVRPAQGQELTLTHTCAESRNPQRVQPVVRCGLDQQPGLGGRQREDLVLRHSWWIYQLGDVAGDKPPAFGRDESSTQD